MTLEQLQNISHSAGHLFIEFPSTTKIPQNTGLGADESTQEGTTLQQRPSLCFLFEDFSP